VSEKVIKPSLTGSWVLIFGALLGPFIIIADRHRSGAIWPWVILTTAFVAFFLHRMSLRYTLSESKLSLTAWWGLGQPEVITLAAVDRIEILKSFSMRLVNRSHIFIHSNLPSEGSITILSQKDPDKIATELKKRSKYIVEIDDNNDI
jgi:hypothetical protein